MLFAQKLISSNLSMRTVCALHLNHTRLDLGETLIWVAHYKKRPIYISG